MEIIGVLALIILSGYFAVKFLSRGQGSGKKAATMDILSLMLFDDELIDAYRHDDNCAKSESGAFYYDRVSDTIYLGAYLYCDNAPHYLGSDTCPGYSQENTYKNIILVMHGVRDKLVPKEQLREQLQGDINWMYHDYENITMVIGFNKMWHAGEVGEVPFEMLLMSAGIPQDNIVYVEVEYTE